MAEETREEEKHRPFNGLVGRPISEARKAGDLPRQRRLRKNPRSSHRRPDDSRALRADKESGFVAEFDSGDSRIFEEDVAF
ncbi:hypothetical protein QJS10_CPB14g00217 [Acorus calamus]|uniref:Uncharacterized protein n=1 Tax=Acorus calamus TaxID=4465 RepID=A0AAV9DBP6_ACOCL|nr:hypothetical protein QJS10_CPB14g00217 [Acorus calamus]